MNVNGKLMELKTLVGYPVSPDLYVGKENKYIVFTYEDERSALNSDNEEQMTQATIQVTFYCPSTYNYMSDKHKIKKALKSLGFEVESINSWVDNAIDETEYTRHVVFVTSIFEKTEE